MLQLYAFRLEEHLVSHAARFRGSPADLLALGGAVLGGAAAWASADVWSVPGFVPNPFFPHEGEPPPSARSSGPPPPHQARKLDGLRVLVVEDDPDARELVTAILEDAGAVVESAESAAAGFAAVSSFRPQLLVSDIGMPDEDGYSLMRRVRALGDSGGRVPSIALTAYTRAEDRAKALAAGFDLHLGKPIRPTDLVNAVKALSSGGSH